MMQPQGQQVVYVTHPVPVSPTYKVNNIGLRISGCFQMVAGIASILLNIVYLAQTTHYRHHSYIVYYKYTGWGAIGTGFWCGIPFLVSGCLGMAATNGQKCLVIGYLVMSIISTVLSAPCLLVWGLAIAVNGPTFHLLRGCSAMMVLTIMAALIELFAGICGAVYCCTGITTKENMVPATSVQYVTSDMGMINQASNQPGHTQFGFPQANGAPLQISTQVPAVLPQGSTTIPEKTPCV